MMGQAADNPLRLEDCQALCTMLPLIDADGTRPQAVIVQVASHLACFVAAAGGTYEPMTIQNGFSEEPLRFVATEETFAHKCIPTVLSKVGFVDTASLAFVDTQLDWRHDELLLQWAAHQNTVYRTTQAASIIVQTYVAERNAPPEPDTNIVWHRPSAGEDATPSRVRTVRRQSRKGAHAIQTTDAPTPRPSHGVSLSLLDNIPAEFDQIVWKLATGSSKGIERYSLRWNHMAAQGKCLTTMEIAARLYDTPTLENLVSTYEELRSAEGQRVSVPMIGFDRRWLWTRSHLHPFSTLSVSPLEIGDLTKFNAVRYTPPLVSSVGRGRLRACAKRCLDMAPQGLLLLDLSDDIICELVGESRARLSFADACRVYNDLSS